MKKRRFFIDCSHIYFYGGNTGIQRVVRNISNNAAIVGSTLNISCSPVIWTGRYFAKIEQIKPIGILYFYQKYMKSLRNTIIKASGYSRFFLPKRIRQFIRRFLHIRPHFSFHLINLLFRKNRLELNKDDVLLAIDSSWNLPNFLSGLEREKERGVTIGFILYDLIPIKFPQFYLPSLVISFKDWLTRIIAISDFCFSISETTQMDLKDFLIEYKGEINETLSLETFRLGVSLDNTKNKKPKIRSKVQRLFKDSKPYLMVSTIEPRKNHNYLIDAFDALWESGVDTSIVIVGKIGWLYETTLRRIKNHAEWKKRIFILNNVTDTELDFCYRNSKALIFPSLYEGFGLPIIEALRRGTPVLASNIRAHKEAGGNFVQYFNINSPWSLVCMIQELERKGLPQSQQSVSQFSWPTWKESTSELLLKVNNLIVESENNLERMDKKWNQTNLSQTIQ